MKNKLVKSGLAAVSSIGFLLLGSCSSTPPNDAIFNSRGGHMPPPRTAGSSIDLTKPATAPVTNNTGNQGLILNNTGTGIIIEENTTPPVQEISFQSPAVSKMTYKVKRGDSLWKVATNHGVSMQDLARENNLTTKSQLKIGQTLTLPPGARLLSPSEMKSSSKSSKKSSGGSQKYKVRKGDSLSVIAYKYGTTTKALKSANGLKSDIIRVNQTLTIPNTNSPRSTVGMGSGSSKKSSTLKATGNVYTVRKGDSLSVIAQKQGTTTKALKSANGLKSDNIWVGQKLVIPGGNKIAAPKKTSKKQKKIEEELFNTPKKKEPKKVVETTPKKVEEDNPFADKPEKMDEPKKTEPKKDTTPANMNVMDVLVVESDTLESLASDFNTTVDLIKKANPNVKGNEDLKPGAVIKVPRGN